MRHLNRYLRLPYLIGTVSSDVSESRFAAVNPQGFRDCLAALKGRTYNTTTNTITPPPPTLQAISIVYPFNSELLCPQEILPGRAACRAPVAPPSRRHYFYAAGVSFSVQHTIEKAFRGHIPLLSEVSPDTYFYERQTYAKGLGLSRTEAFTTDFC